MVFWPRTGSFIVNLMRLCIFVLFHFFVRIYQHLCVATGIWKPLIGAHWSSKYLGEWHAVYRLLAPNSRTGSTNAVSITPHGAPLTQTSIPESLAHNEVGPNAWRTAEVLSALQAITQTVPPPWSWCRMRLTLVCTQLSLLDWNRWSTSLRWLMCLSLKR